MEKFEIGPPQDDRDLELAKLKLALLKENFQFKTFYATLIENIDFSYRAEKKPSGVSLDVHYLNQFLKKIKTEPRPLQSYFAKLGFRPDNIRGFLLLMKVFFHEILLLLDPKKDLPQIWTEFRSPDLIQKILPVMFESTGICELRNTGGLLTRWSKRNPSNSPYQIQPYERIYSVDLRKRKNKLLKEFEQYIDKELAIRKKIIQKEQDDPWGYDMWAPQKGRYRKEAWGQLEIWGLRRQRKNFQEIARELTLTQDTVKKRFYKAYYLTQGKPYDPELLRKEIWRVRKSEIQNTCHTCPNRNNCVELCPDMLAIAEQDTLKYSREKYLKEDSDSYKDYLFKKTLIF